MTIYDFTSLSTYGFDIDGRSVELKLQYFLGTFDVTRVDGQTTLTCTSEACLGNQIVLSAPGQVPCLAQFIVVTECDYFGDDRRKRVNCLVPPNDPKKRQSSNVIFVALSVLLPTVSTLIGDPHIVGPNGEHFDFQGKPGGFYTLFSSRHVSVSISVSTDD